MSKVLVTGATGFIGQHIVKEFSEAGHEVSCLVRESSNVDAIRKYQPRLFRGDVLHQEQLNSAVVGQDIVVHLAGLTKSFSTDRLYQVNENGTRNVVKSCADQLTPPVLIYMSSLAAAGPALGSQGLTETEPMRPVSHYGKSKLAGEKALGQFADRVPVSVLRPGIVLGEGDRDGFEIFKGAAMGFIIIPSLKDRIFSVIHARDLARAVALTADCGQRLCPELNNGTYFASGREEWTFAHLGQVIGELLGKKRVRPIYNPNVAIWAAGAIYEMISRLRKQTYIMSLDKAREATAGAWHCNPEKLIQLGFSPAPLVQRLEETIEWYLEQGWLKAKAKIKPPHNPKLLKSLQKANQK